jgi:hypothetical protein
MQKTLSKLECSLATMSWHSLAIMGNTEPSTSKPVFGYRDQQTRASLYKDF